MAKKEIKTNKKENSKNKKSFFKDFKAELKKVVWPTPKQLVNNTVAVITIVLITAIIVFVLDLAFEFANKQGIEKVKEVITSSNTTNTSDSNSESTNETQTPAEDAEAKSEDTANENKEAEVMDDQISQAVENATTVNNSSEDNGSDLPF